MDKGQYEAEHCDVMIQQQGNSEKTPCQCFKHEIPILKGIYGENSVEEYDRYVDEKHFVTGKENRGEIPDLKESDAGVLHRRTKKKYGKVVLDVVKEAARLDARYGSGKGAIFLNMLSLAESVGKKKAAGSGAVTMK